MYVGFQGPDPENLLCVSFQGPVMYVGFQGPDPENLRSEDLHQDRLVSRLKLRLSAFQN
jgi:hypothetical protein